MYGEMRSVESAMDHPARALSPAAMMATIDQLEERAIHLKVPTAYDSSLYTLREHIGLIRSHLEALRANEAPRGEGETPSPKPRPPGQESGR